MGQAARIKRNTVFVLLSHIVRLLANVVLFIGIARFYGPTEFGQFTAAHTLSIIFILLADFGFDVLLSSEIARHRDRAAELAESYFTVKVVLAFVATAGMIFTASLQHVSEPTRWLMYTFSLYVLLSALVNFFFALFKGFEEMHHETRISFIMNLLLLLVVVVLSAGHAPPTILAAVFVGSRVVGLVLALAVAARFVPLRKFRFTLRSRPDFLAIGVYGLNALFGNLFFTQDTLLLSWWAGDQQVGIYQSAFKVVSLALVALDVLFATLLPVLSRLHETGSGRWLSVGRLLHKTLVFVGLPIGLIMIVYAEQVMSLVYGNRGYAEAVPLLRIFGFIVLVRYACDASATMLTSSHRQHIRLLLAGGAVVLNYILNAYAIPRYTTMGAAFVSLVINALVCVGYVVAAWKDVKSWLIELRTYVPVLVAAVTGILLWEYRPVSFWIGAPAVLLLLATTAYVAGFDRSERMLLFSLRELNVVGKQHIHQESETTTI